MKSLLFSSVLGAAIGITIGSQILSGDQLNFTTEAGPSIKVLARPIKLSASKKSAVKPTTVAKKKSTSDKSKRVAKRRSSPRNRTVEMRTAPREAATIATLVSRGLGN